GRGLCLGRWNHSRRCDVENVSDEASPPKPPSASRTKTGRSTPAAPFLFCALIGTPSQKIVLGSDLEQETSFSRRAFAFRHGAQLLRALMQLQMMIYFRHVHNCRTSRETASANTLRKALIEAAGFSPTIPAAPMGYSVSPTG